MKDFNVQYPPLVEQAYLFLKAQGESFSKPEIYKMLVENELINEDGTPTKKALEQGLVSETGNDPIKQFKAHNPELAFIPDEHFQVVDGEVLFDKTAMLETCKLVLRSPAFTEKQKTEAKQWIKEINENL